MSGSSPTLTGDGASPLEAPAISDDGRYVTYAHTSSNLVPGQNGDASQDVFLFDRETQKNTLVSHQPGAPTTMNGLLAAFPVISGDGRYVAYESEADRLVAGQVQDGPIRNVFVYDRETGENELASHALGSFVKIAGPSSYWPRISRDGNSVVFTSEAPGLVPGETEDDLGEDTYLYHRETGGLTLVSHAFSSERKATSRSSVAHEALSADGSVVLFQSFSPQIIEGDTTDGESDAFIFLLKK